MLILHTYNIKKSNLAIYKIELDYLMSFFANSNLDHFYSLMQYSQKKKAIKAVILIFFLFARFTTILFWIIFVFVLSLVFLRTI